MKECGVYHCEKHEDGNTCFLALDLRHQADNRVIGPHSLSKESLRLIIERTKAMAKNQGCSCEDQVGEAVLFAQGVMDLIPDEVPEIRDTV